MCTAYWTLADVSFTCPNCATDVTDDLQTHFMGDFGSMWHSYALGAPVEELVTVSAVVGRRGQADAWIGECPRCNASIDFGGRVEAGVVTAVWPERYHTRDVEETVDDELRTRRVVSRGEWIDI